MRDFRPPVTLVLVRHGEADYRGPGGGVLTARGRDQARAIRAALLPFAPFTAYSSPLGRACETAACAVLEPLLDARLSEFDSGTQPPLDTDGRILAPNAAWRPGDGDGETLRAFQQRVDSILDELARRHAGETGVLITHAGVVDAAVRWAYGLGPESPWLAEGDIENASITVIEHWPNGRDEPGPPRFSVIKRLGDTSHLAALDRNP